MSLQISGKPLSVPDSGPPAVIRCDHLSHRFVDGTPALEDIDLCVAAGSFVVLAGANGSGKTTLLRHFNGLLRPTRGTVCVAGRDVAAEPLFARRQVGLVFQDPDSQIVGETVREDVAFGPRNLRLPVEVVERRVAAALAAVGLDGQSDRPPHLLSGGAKRRLAIAGVLAMEPRVVALDEPFANLDFPGSRDLLDQLRQLHRSGRTVLVATHDLERVVSLAQRLVLLDRGRVVADGDPAAVMPLVERHGVRRPCSVRWGLGVRPWAD